MVVAPFHSDENSSLLFQSVMPIRIARAGLPLVGDGRLLREVAAHPDGIERIGDIGQVRLGAKIGPSEAGEAGRAGADAAARVVAPLISAALNGPHSVVGPSLKVTVGRRTSPDSLSAYAEMSELSRTIARKITLAVQPFPVVIASMLPVYDVSASSLETMIVKEVVADPPPPFKTVTVTG